MAGNPCSRFWCDWNTVPFVTSKSKSFRLSVLDGQWHCWLSDIVRPVVAQPVFVRTCVRYSSLRLQTWIRCRTRWLLSTGTAPRALVRWLC